MSKAGFVALAGRSNVGKSTLLNALIGTKLAITSPKPQTTRHAVQGVLHRPDGQIVFVDSPGILMKKHDVLTNALNRQAREALEDIDLVLYVVDPTRAIGPEEENVMRLIKASGTPTILVINKVDEARTRYLEDYRALAPEFDDVVEVSALRDTHLPMLVDKVLERMPEGEPMYPEDQVTNLDARMWHAELIREKLFLVLRQELPYTTTAVVDEIEERADKNGRPVLYIAARILTDSDQHKRMIIGKGGATVRRVGSMVRRELEQVNGIKVFVDLDVETDPHWLDRLR